MADPAGRWLVEHQVASAARLHALEVPSPARRRVWVMHPTAPALVLGSIQGARGLASDVRTGGVEVVVRHSGGGAVLVDPPHDVWVDVVLPRRDRLWVDDVSASSRWLGETWADALGSLDVEAEVHSGPPVRAPEASVACFAGLCAGEVSIGGRKVVGISQRRTRAWARLQCVVRTGPPVWDELGALLGDDDLAGLLHRSAAVAPVTAGALLTAFLHSLDAR